MTRLKQGDLVILCKDGELWRVLVTSASTAVAFDSMDAGVAPPVVDLYDRRIGDIVDGWSVLRHRSPLTEQAMEQAISRRYTRDLKAQKEAAEAYLKAIQNLWLDLEDWKYIRLHLHEVLHTHWINSGHPIPFRSWIESLVEGDRS